MQDFLFFIFIYKFFLNQGKNASELRERKIRKLRNNKTHQQETMIKYATHDVRQSARSVSESVRSQ